MTQLVHQLVGYDPRTERVAYEHDFRPDEWSTVRRFLHAEPDDPAMVDVYPISRSTVLEIGVVIRDDTPGNLDYFIECSARD